MTVQTSPELTNRKNAAIAQGVGMSTQIYASYNFV